MLTIKIIRFKTSYDFKLDASMPSSYENNVAHNSEDVLELIDDDTMLFCCKCQTVQNLDWGDYKSNSQLSYGDTIAPGNFNIRLFCQPRNFHNTVHEIFYANTISGKQIDKNAMQFSNGKWSGRWLMHDRWNEKTNKDTVNAWSAGCIILKTADFERLNALLKSKNCRSGYTLKACIKEV